MDKWIVFIDKCGYDMQVMDGKTADGRATYIKIMDEQIVDRLVVDTHISHINLIEHLICVFIILLFFRFNLIMSPHWIH